MLVPEMGLRKCGAKFHGDSVASSSTGTVAPRNHTLQTSISIGQKLIWPLEESGKKRNSGAWGMEDVFPSNWATKMAKLSDERTLGLDLGDTNSLVLRPTS